ncbi:MAG: hypothetical protein WC795_01070 [Candidatus Paceibacterota bacterium]|jgi:hypothetical protein
MENFPKIEAEQPEEKKLEQKSGLGKTARKFALAGIAMLASVLPSKESHAQTKDKIPQGTIITHDPNDSRLETYRDSLNLYNIAGDLVDLVKKHNNLEPIKIEHSTKANYEVWRNSQSVYKKFKKAFDKLKLKNKKEPKPTHPGFSSVTSESLPEGKGKYVTEFFYKKPAQKIIYKPETKVETEPEKKIQEVISPKIKKAEIQDTKQGEIKNMIDYEPNTTNLSGGKGQYVYYDSTGHAKVISPETYEAFKKQGIKHK